jgi:hypothetical protein
MSTWSTCSSTRSSSRCAGMGRRRRCWSLSASPPTGTRTCSPRGRQHRVRGKLE